MVEKLDGKDARATMEEVADTVLFLASDRARYYNGAKIIMDGGLNVNDEVTQLNGAATTDETVKQALFATAPGTAVKMQLKHGALTHDLSLTLQPDPDRTYQIQPVASRCRMQQ